MAIGLLESGPNSQSDPRGALGRPPIGPTGIVSRLILKVMKPTSRKSYKTYMEVILNYD